MITQQLKKHFMHLKNHRRITPQDLLVFFKQFSTLFSAGIAILKCFDILEQTQANKQLRLVIHTIQRNLLTGHTLYHCLRQHRQHFSTLTCHLIQLGEQTGKLDLMLIIITQHLDKQIAQRNHIKNILFYPLIVSSFALIITFCMLYFVIPRFVELFQDSHAKIPPLTQFIFSLSLALHRSLWPLLLSLGTAITFLIYSRPSQPFKQRLYGHAATLPLIHSFLIKLTLARFTRHLSITLTAGLPLTDALAIACQPLLNTPLTRHLADIRLKILSGQPIHAAMQPFSDFPTLMIQMIKIGETSGTLEAMLAKIADWLETDIEQLVTRFGQLLEPLIMIVLGVLIGGLLIGLYLPIFTLGSAI